MGTAVGAVGIEPNSDKAIFENVNVEARLGKDKGIKLRLPIMILAWFNKCGKNTLGWVSYWFCNFWYWTNYR